MYNNYKVKVLIFAGRKDTMQILIQQLKSDYIDEIIIGVNTNNQEDLDYIYSLKNSYDKIVYDEVPSNIARCTQESYRYFYSKMEDEDTIYFKLDDDIIYISPNYFEDTLKFRTEHPEYICIYPTIINNPLCNYLLASKNNIKFKYTHDFMSLFMWLSWKDPEVAAQLHKEFASDKTNEKWLLDNLEFRNEFTCDCTYGHIRPSINAICFFGKDFKALDMKNFYLDDEEHLTNFIFRTTSRCHCILGNTLVSHYAFFTQREALNSTNTLQLYK